MFESITSFLYHIKNDFPDIITYFFNDNKRINNILLMFVGYCSWSSKPLKIINYRVLIMHNKSCNILV